MHHTSTVNIENLNPWQTLHTFDSAASIGSGLACIYFLEICLQLLSLSCQLVKVGAINRLEEHNGTLIQFIRAIQCYGKAENRTFESAPKPLRTQLWGNLWGNLSSRIRIKKA